MRGPIRTVVVAVAMIGLGVFSGAWVVLWALRGSYLTALIMLGVSIGSIGFAVYNLGTTTLGLAVPRTESGSFGTLLRPSKFVNGVSFLTNSSVLLAAALFLGFSPFGMVDFAPSGAMRFSVPFSCVFVLCFGLPALIRSVKIGGIARLHVHPGGINVWDGQWGSMGRADWSDVEQILDRRLKKKKVGNGLIVFALPKGRSAVLKSDDITGDGATLREWVRFYWSHPECRDELVDGRGLQRLADKAY